MARLSHNAYTRQDCRIAIISSDLPDLKKKLALAIEKIESTPGQGWALPQKIFYGTGAPEGHLGFVFPGQGSQYTSMGADIAMNFDVARAIWDAAANVNPELRDTVFPRPGFGEEAERSKFVPFKNTSVVQPAIGRHVGRFACLAERTWRRTIRCGGGGGGLGELSALYSADAIDFTDLLRVCKPRIEIFNNAGTSSTSKDAVDYREYLAGQILMPVRFIAQIEAMYEAGVRIFIEVGPGNILQSFIAQILNQKPHQVIALDKRGANGLDSLWEALGRLIVAGIDVDLSALWKNVATSEAQARKVEGRMTVPISGANPKFPLQNNHGSPAASKPAPRPDDPAHKPTDKVPPSAAEAVTAMPQVETAPNGVDNMMHQDSHSCSPVETPSSNMVKPQDAQGNSSDRVASPSEAIPDAVAARRTSLLTASRAMTHDDAPVASSPHTAPVAAPTASAPAASEISGILMEIIAEMTGYPVEMLETHMELEADLGVDSIKRIEIFSALR
ncbi:MAG: phosphopantetheine-binding protein [Acetobacteraceae bacterium]